MVASMGAAVLFNDTVLPVDDLRFAPDELLSNELEVTAAFVGDTGILRRLLNNLLHGKTLSHFGNGIPFLTGMSLDGESLFGGFYTV